MEGTASMSGTSRQATSRGVARDARHTPASLLDPLLKIARRGVIPDSAQTAHVAVHASSLHSLTAGRVYELLTPALCAKHPHVALQWLLDAGVLDELLPELAATVTLSQEAGRRHKDVWAHTKIVVMQAVPRPAVRWAAVLHDIGKVTTRRFVGRGVVTFHGHAEEGRRMFCAIARRIGFPPATRSRVDDLILYHQRPGQYGREWSDAAVRRFAREMGAGLRDVLDLSRADVTSRRPGQRRRCLFAISELARRIRALQALDARVSPLPPGFGRALMESFRNLAPGPRIGVLRRQLLELCEAGMIASGRDAVYYVEVLVDRGLLTSTERSATASSSPAE